MYIHTYQASYEQIFLLKPVRLGGQVTQIWKARPVQLRYVPLKRDAHTWSYLTSSNIYHLIILTLHTRLRECRFDLTAIQMAKQNRFTVPIYPIPDHHPVPGLTLSGTRRVPMTRGADRRHRCFSRAGSSAIFPVILPRISHVTTVAAGLTIGGPIRCRPGSVMVSP